MVVSSTNGAPMEQGRPESAHRSWKTEPTLTEVLILTVVCYLIYVGLIVLLDNYALQVKTFGDNKPYVAIATAIRHWDFASLRTWQLWGLPYAMVAFSFLTHTSFLTALLVISVACSFLTVAISDRLWGGWVAALFATVSREWMERSLLGGAEPLFLALVVGSFLAARRQRWLVASLLASLSTIVRPMGIFVLVAVGIVLLLRKQFKTLAAATLIGIFVGGLDVVPFKVYQGNSFENVQAYGQADGSQGMPITYPFLAIIRRPALGPVTAEKEVTSGKTTQLNLARTAMWISVVLLGVVAMFLNKGFRAFARNHTVEVLFCALYIALLFTYNSAWARTAFPRYAIPVLPFLILAFERWIPKDRRFLWAFALASTVLSAFSTLGITNSIAIVRRVL